MHRAGTAPGVVNVDVGIKGDFALKPLAPPTLYEYFGTPELTTVTETVDGSVNIIGSGFTPGDKVFCSLGPTLGFVPGVVIDSNTITCEVPEGAIDEIDPAAVFVLDEDGNNLLAPDPESEGIVGNTQSTIDVVGPTSGPYTGGTTVVIQGDHFTPTSMCRFGHYDPTPAVFVSSTQIVCEAPAQARDGGVAVEVSNNGFDWTSAGIVFAYEASAQLDYVAPRRGSVDGGSTLRLTGSQMPNTEALSCRVGTSRISARWISDTASSCHIPAHAEGVVPVGLQSHGGLGYVGRELPLRGAAERECGDPTLGAVSGGTRVTLTGANFPTTGRATCRFGATPVLASSARRRRSCAALAARGAD